MKKPKVKSSEIVYEGYFNVRKDLLEHPSGHVQPYTSFVLSTDAAVVLAQDENGLWILNREYRHPTGEFLLGCPGGRLEAGEDPIEGGRRELFEETGYWAEEIEIMGSCYPFPSLCDQKIYYLLAKGAVKKGPQNLDPLECIEVELKTDEEIKKESKIDGILLTALWYKDHFC